MCSMLGRQMLAQVQAHVIWAESITKFPLERYDTWRSMNGI